MGKGYPYWKNLCPPIGHYFIDYRLVLFRGVSARGVDQSSARLKNIQGPFNEPSLEAAQHPGLLGVFGQRKLRTEAVGSFRRAGRVYQHPLKRCSGGKVVALVTANEERSRPQPINMRPENTDPVDRDVVGHHQGPIPHKLCQVRCLTARCGT